MESSNCDSVLWDMKKSCIIMYRDLVKGFTEIA